MNTTELGSDVADVEKFEKLVNEYKDPEVVSAILRDGASFELLVKTIKKTRGFSGELSDAQLQDLANCNEIYRLFEKKHGGITNLYVCGLHHAAAVLTDSSQYFTEYNLGYRPAIESLLIRIDQLAIETARLLKGKDLEKCTAMIYSVAKKTLRLLDSDEGYAESEAGKQTLELVNSQLLIAKQYHERAAQVRAQMTYFSGALIGVVFLIIAAALVGVLVSEDAMIGFESHADFYYLLLCGGIGAVVSVMWRLNSTTKRLFLDHDRESRAIFLIGIFRPILGGIFAILFYALIQTGLIGTSLIDNMEEQQQYFFFLIVGFLAGFSERLVPDILETTEEKFGGTVNDSADEDAGK